jgi:hypothetical protein
MREEDVPVCRHGVTASHSITIPQLTLSQKRPLHAVIAAHIYISSAVPFDIGNGIE